MQKQINQSTGALRLLARWCKTTGFTPGYACLIAVGDGRLPEKLKRGSAQDKTVWRLVTWLVCHPARKFRKKGARIKKRVRRRDT